MRTPSLAAAQAIYDLEKSLAETTLTTRGGGRTPSSRTTRPRSRKSSSATHRWTGAPIDELGIAGTDRMIVTETAYLDRLGQILAETPIETLRDYLRVQLLWNFYNNLDLELEKTAFTFFQALGGNR